MNAAYQATREVLARQLARDLAGVVDVALKMRRDPNDPASDGQVAVMTVFLELERRGFIVVQTRR
jgi:hypothetical protein